ncbi:MAG: hypothetical protein FWG98_04905 [Candidatus Cloacimonetes bacterium]|nr:hypothetical protein [Candidatus Cloacimonadota bacterium]
MEIQNCNIKHILVLAMILIMMTILLASRNTEVNSVYVIENIWTNDDLNELISLISKTQPDGTLIDFEIVGSSSRRTMEVFLRKNGHTLVLDKDSQYYCWAYQDSLGQLSSTGKPVHLYDPDILGLDKDIRISIDRLEELDRRNRELIKRSVR